MTKCIRAAAIAAAAVLLATVAAGVETTWIYSVQLSAAVQDAPPRIELKWPADHLPVLSYTVFRKAPDERPWPAEGVTLPGDATSHVDENVHPGRLYEYQVIKHGTGYTGYGYITAALNAPLVDDRGKVILVVDNSVAGAIGNELARLERDLAGDGWTVVRHEVARDANPADVKARIKSEYDADRARPHALLLIGHVSVVRSGNLNVDGHGARPMPADIFYADLDGNWTDANGDGVYDQNLQPSELELQVGRIDFANLPGAFAASSYPSEIELLRRYLDKNHAYRHAVIRPARRAIISGLGDANGQAYAAAAYRNFATTVGAENVTTVILDDAMPSEERWVSRLAKDDYLFAYGQGGGSDISVSTLGTHGAYYDVWSYDFVDLKIKGTFYFMFGSWFSDWAQSDNVLRSLLAAPDYGLASAWSGRPQIFIHSMGAGETIGHGFRLSQNNDGRLYQNQVQRQLRGVHIALLGDPTLRLYPVAPPTQVTVNMAGNDAFLSWTRSRDAVAGYHIYRGPGASGPFTRVTDAPVDDTQFGVVDGASGDTTYSVRAVVLQRSPSGAYFNASQGALAQPASLDADVEVSP